MFFLFFHLSESIKTSKSIFWIDYYNLSSWTQVLNIKIIQVRLSKQQEKFYTRLFLKLLLLPFILDKKILIISFPIYTTRTTTFIKGNAINNSHLIFVAIMPYLILSVFWTYSMGELLIIISKVELLSGNLRSRFKSFSSQWRESISLLKNGRGEIKISDRGISNGLIIKYVFRDFKNFLSLTRMRISFTYLILGHFNIKIFW